MKFTARQIAETIGGRVEGDPEVSVSRVVKIDEEGEGGLSFLANPKYESFIYTTGADVIIVSSDFKAEKEIKATLVRVDEPYLAFAALLEFYNKMKLDKSGVSEHAFIHETAKIGENVYIGEFAFIGKEVVLEDDVKVYPHTYIGDNAKLGEGTVVFAGARFYHDTIIGAKCIIHSGVIIGSDGFGFA
ncbi:MAG: UDP-3-O-(3-hydroxymyristoyl)glucosamine N-acyltransferase, partial [Bacteroidales bacterium]|nr:UDP-3-O-(3-hydroxymyristoyl)glucosamine N-acyltransferase [Bacteroidales bacterium]